MRTIKNRAPHSENSVDPVVLKSHSLESVNWGVQAKVADGWVGQLQHNLTLRSLLCMTTATLCCKYKDVIVLVLTSSPKPSTLQILTDDMLSLCRLRGSIPCYFDLLSKHAGNACKYRANTAQALTQDVPMLTPTSEHSCPSSCLPQETVELSHPP